MNCTGERKRDNKTDIEHGDLVHLGLPPSLKTHILERSTCTSMTHVEANVLKKREEKSSRESYYKICTCYRKKITSHETNRESLCVTFLMTWSEAVLKEYCANENKTISGMIGSTSSTRLSSSERPN